MSDLTTLNIIYLICIIIGAVLFITRLILMLVGAHSGDVDVHSDIHTDVHVDHDASGDSDISFKILTLQGVMGFCLIFGLTGFILNSIASMGGFFSTTIASIAGFASMYLIAKLFSALINLHSDGTINIANTIGKEGKVYLTIPAGGIGKVQVVVQGRLQEFEAMSDNNIEIKTGESIMVVFYKGNTLIVHKI